MLAYLFKVVENHKGMALAVGKREVNLLHWVHLRQLNSEALGNRGAHALQRACLGQVAEEDTPIEECL